MVPDTRYAILGLLRRGPSHGYGLTKRFGELLGPGWAINRGQVYEMLGTLESEGWIEVQPPKLDRGSQVYRITGAGIHAFVAWREEHALRPAPHRASFYLRLALAEPAEGKSLLKDIEVEKQACVDKLNAYNSQSAPSLEDASDWETLAREAIDEDVTTQLDGKLKWLENLRVRVEHQLADSPERATGEMGAQTGREDAAA